MEYKVIQDGLIKELVAKVNAAITKGWRPQGGPVTAAPYGPYIQAMIRDLKNPENESGK
jgi:Domain of unknown function (DUF1737)